MARRSQRAVRDARAARRPLTADEVDALAMLRGRLADRADERALAEAEALVTRLWLDGVPAQDLAQVLRRGTHTVTAWIDPAVRSGSRVKDSGPRPDRHLMPLDQARVPHGTRPLTEAEHARLLAVAAQTRKVNYAIATPRERAAAQRAQARLAGLLLTLFNKRVGTAHLADVLGRSEANVTVLLRRARQQTGTSPGDRRPWISGPKPAPARPARRDLTRRQAQRLRAAWRSVPGAHGGRDARSLAMDAVRALANEYCDTGVPVAQMAAALGISHQRLRQILRTTVRPPEPSLTTDQVLRLHHHVLLADVHPGRATPRGRHLEALAAYLQVLHDQPGVTWQQIADAAELPMATVVHLATLSTFATCPGLPLPQEATSPTDRPTRP